MSLHYGITNNEEEILRVIPKQRKMLTYSWTYNAISDGTAKKPVGVLSGYPVPYAATYGLGENSTFTLLTHKFDADSKIGTELRMEYKLWCLRNTGASTSAVIWSVNIGTEHKVGSTNIFNLNKTFKFGNHVSGLESIIGFQIEIKILSSTGYGNESVIDVLVVI